MGVRSPPELGGCRGKMLQAVSPGGEGAVQPRRPAAPAPSPPGSRDQGEGGSCQAALWQVWPHLCTCRCEARCLMQGLPKDPHLS